VGINYIKLIFSLVLTLVAGFIGSFFTTPYIASWYAHINKPTFIPPNWLFGPVWTLLFIMMGISLYLIWQSKGNSQTAIIVFFIQLALNILWSFLFFKSQSPLYAFIEIIILWFAILATIWQFNKINHIASILLIPYICWVSFAAFLNLSVYLLNK